MAEFPSDIMLDIFSRLPVKSLARSRCVSKSWRNTINDPYFESMRAKRPSNDRMLIMFHQFPTDRPNLPSPCTLSFLERKDQEEPGGCTLEVPKVPPVMKFKCNDWYSRYPKDIILGSCNGLLYSSQGRRDGNSLVVINPLRKECYELPPINRRLAHLQQSWGVRSGWGVGYDLHGLAVEETCGLGFDEKTNTFKMVSVVIREHIWAPEFYRVNHGPYTMVHVLGTDSWRMIPQIPSYPISGQGVFANGCLHWLITGNEDGDRDGDSDGDRDGDVHPTYLSKGLITFNMANEEFGFINLPKRRHSDSDWINEQLIDLHGDVGYAYNVLDCYIAVWVMKEKEWVLHCEFKPKPPLMYAGFLKVLGFWNENGDVLVANSICNQVFVYKLKRDSLDEVKFNGWEIQAAKEIRIYQSSVFSTRYTIDQPTTNQKKD
ncbi:hypothetical protein R6Q59_015260 [Mikania micrantha]